MSAVEVDASEHYEAAGSENVPSALAVVIDTNPRAWANLAPTVSIDSALANLLVFVNAHLACNNSNEVIVIAAHPGRAEFLYPLRTSGGGVGDDNDVVMADDAPVASANKFPQFLQLEGAAVSSLKRLMTETITTRPDALTCPTSQLSGALSLALARINKSFKAHAATTEQPSSGDNTSRKNTSARNIPMPFRGRIFVVSVSDSEPNQYVASINAAHAAAHLQIPIDALALSGQATFLQQASSMTGGFFINAPAADQLGLLAYLMFGFADDPGGREILVEPSNSAVDFRGACFCHGKLVSVGYVCSTCLSVFCKPQGKECQTCGVTLEVGRHGMKPAILPRSKTKRKRPANGDGEESGAG